jgi:hypothetical protein
VATGTLNVKGKKKLSDFCLSGGVSLTQPMHTACCAGIITQGCLCHFYVSRAALIIKSHVIIVTTEVTVVVCDMGEPSIHTAVDRLGRGGGFTPKTPLLTPQSDLGPFSVLSC